MSFVADTDVLIDFLRDRGQNAKRIELELKTGRLHTTSVTAFELWVGAKSPNQKTAVETLLAAMSIIPLDAQASAKAGEVYQLLESKGQTIGMADSLIAGICLSRDSILITGNKKHFKRVTGLKIAGDHPSLTD